MELAKKKVVLDWVAESLKSGDSSFQIVWEICECRAPKEVMNVWDKMTDFEEAEITMDIGKATMAAIERRKEEEK